jgi:hypothetical protein
MRRSISNQASFAELVRLSGEYGVRLFVDGANYDDVARDRDEKRRAVTISKLAKFQQLRGVPIPDDAKLTARYGSIGSENDRSDVRFLVALEAKAVDFVVSQDIGLHRRAERAGLGSSVLTVEEALEWLKRLFAVKASSYRISPSVRHMRSINLIPFSQACVLTIQDSTRGLISVGASTANAGCLSSMATSRDS